MLENRGLELIIIAVVVLVLFGAKRLPDSARALGKSLRILKSEVGAMKADDAPHPAETPVPEPAPTVRTIQAAPGDGSSQPTAESQRQPTVRA